MPKSIQVSIKASLAILFLVLSVDFASAQENLSARGKSVYEQIKAFKLSGDAETVTGLQLKRDRAEMTFDGTFYFTGEVEGKITGAVFIGQGKFRTEIPDNVFEKENVRRMLGADVIESDFKSAVLRFSDDTIDIIGKNRRYTETLNSQAQKLATETDAKTMKETGANIAARLTQSLLNAEKEGFFFATFDDGKRGRFSFLFDPQNRIPVANFNLNAGEKGLIYKYDSNISGSEIWLAFYSLQDYKNGRVDYSDMNELIDVTDYKMDVDLREHKSRLGLKTKVSFIVKKQNRVIPFTIGESLGEYENRRLKKQMRIKSVKFEGAESPSAMEDWEAGFTVFLPREVKEGEKLELDLELAGDFMYDAESVRDCYYPDSNTAWFPRHGYLDRAKFDISYYHPKRFKIASVGVRLSEEPDLANKDTVITKSKLDYPVSFATFALGPFQRHSKMVKWDQGGEPIPVEFNSLPGEYLAIKEDFILAELDNSLRYFHAMFGKYPYPLFSASFHPFGFGQGLPTMLMIPPTDRASKFTYSFIAHETAHQWWGNIVAWRSYRDQWLSEGFAEYSGMLYTGLRDGKKSREDLIDRGRNELKDPPVTLTGVGKGRLVDVGPLILGHRLNTSKTLGAYQALIYQKGALVLRMLHFLFTNPSNGDGQAFFNMMTDFVNRHRDGFASTDDFRMVANEHFVKSPIAQKYGMKDLNWFFYQWVYKTELPTYKMEYQIIDQPGGAAIVKGFITQENVPEGWFMPLPVMFSFDGDKQASGTVHAYGAKTPFEIKLPMRPKKVELDPQRWVLSAGTSTKG